MPPRPAPGLQDIFWICAYYLAKISQSKVKNPTPIGPAWFDAFHGFRVVSRNLIICFLLFLLFGRSGAQRDGLLFDIISAELKARR
jgi:hypothetical protein